MDLDILFREHTKLKSAYDRVIAELDAIKARLDPIHAAYQAHVDSQAKIESLRSGKPESQPKASVEPSVADASADPASSSLEAPPKPESDPPGPEAPASEQPEKMPPAAPTSDAPGPVGAGVDVSAEAQDQTPKP